MEKQQQKLMWRFYLVVLIIFFFALAIGTKIFVIQWIEGPVFEVMANNQTINCLLYTSPSPRDRTRSRMPSSA